MFKSIIKITFKNKYFIKFRKITQHEKVKMNNIDLYF